MAISIDEKNKTKHYLAPGIAITLFCVKMTLGELSGGGFNPARSIGPSIIAG